MLGIKKLSSKKNQNVEREKKLLKKKHKSKNAIKKPIQAYLPNECSGPKAIHECAVSRRPCIKRTGGRVSSISDDESFPIRCSFKM